MTCFACRRRYQSEKTYINSFWKKFFCDIKINTNAKKTTCERCCLIMFTPHCEKGHQKLCNGRGHFGWFCLKCKHFTYKKDNMTSDEIKKSHVCGVTTCRTCRQPIEPKSETTHLCQIRKEKPSKFWPCLAFLNIEFCEFNSDDCKLCFDLKKQFKEKNNLTWKELFENDSFPSLNCKQHECTQAIYEPLLYSVNKENRTKRGIFSHTTISNICSKEKNENVITYNYFDLLEKPSKFVPSKTISKAVLDIKNNLIKDNITHQFISLLIDEEWTNTTILINDEYSMKLVIYFCIFAFLL